MAIIASDLISAAQTALLDPTGQYWTPAELLGYISEAQRAIVNIKPDANVQTEDLALVAGVKQSLPALAIRLIDIPRNTGGAAITAVDRRDLDRHVPSWTQTTAATTIEHYMYDDRYPGTFAVYPPAATGASVEASFSATLADVASATATLDLAEPYQPALLDYVLFRAHSKDTDAAMPQRAQSHYQMFVQQLGLQRQANRADTAGQPNPTNPRELQ